MGKSRQSMTDRLLRLALGPTSIFVRPFKDFGKIRKARTPYTSLPGACSKLAKEYIETGGNHRRAFRFKVRMLAWLRSLSSEI